jgi:hypothetical protein
MTKHRIKTHTMKFMSLANHILKTISGAIHRAGNENISGALVKSAFASIRFHWNPLESAIFQWNPESAGFFLVRLCKIKIQWIPESTGIRSILYRRPKRKEKSKV